jgi:hypothetical protein
MIQKRKKRSNMNNFKRACLEISETLSKLHYEGGDISDIGNEIGIILGNYIDENDHGWNKDGFIAGLNHGI